MSTADITPDDDAVEEMHRHFDDLDKHYRQAIAVFDTPPEPEPPTGFAHFIASNWYWMCVIAVGVILGDALYFLITGGR